MSVKNYLRTKLQKILANMPEKKGIKFLLNLENKFELFLLGVVKIDEKKKGLIHPRHTITNLNQFLLDNINHNDRVLDIGCGYGYTSNLVAQKSKFVLGIDLREEAIISCREKYKKVNLFFENKDLFSISDKDNFDLIVLSNVLEHIDNRMQFLNQCSKIAKKLLIIVPAFDRDWKVPYKKKLNVEWRKNLDHRLEYTQKILCDELNESNYKVDQIFSRWGNYCCKARVMGKNN